MLGCPLWTLWTYLVQQLLCCGQVSAKVDILSRFVKFFHSLRHSASHEVQVLCRYLSRDMQSVTGKNLQLVQDLTNLDPWTTSYGKLKAAEMLEVSQQDKWCLPYLCSLLGQRSEAHSSGLEDEETRLDELIHSLVTKYTS
jgi:hypothetical protein